MMIYLFTVIIQNCILLMMCKKSVAVHRGNQMKPIEGLNGQHAKLNVKA